MRRVHLIVTLAVGAAALGGCASQQASSAEDFSGTEREVAQVVDDLQAAGRGGDAEEICSRIFSAELADSVKAGSSGCADEVDRAIRDVNSYDLQVTGVQVSGSTATADVRQRDQDSRATIELAREGRGWRITSLGGAAQ